MQIINYKLKKVADCELEKACWFYLTDSHYFLQFGDVKIFEYNLKSVKKYKLSHQYLDYYFSRLLEDIFEVLERTIQPIPKEIFKYFDTNEKHENLVNSLSDWYYGVKNSKEYFIDIFDKQIDRESLPEPSKEKESVLKLLGDDLLWNGELQRAYLKDGPICYFFHIEDKMHIYYDCACYNKKNAWTAKTGMFETSYQKFINEIESLLERFFTEMEQQIEEAINTLSETKYAYNAKELREEQIQRKKLFTVKFEKIKNGTLENPLDWQEVAKCLSKFTNDKNK